MSLVKSINNLPEVVYPDSFSRGDIENLTRIIGVAKSDVLPYDGEYKAEWLLVEFKSNNWITTNKGRERQEGGEWVGTVNINWDILLPNGLRLTNKKYRVLLDVCKKAAWLTRSGYSSGKLISLNTWVNQMRYVLLIVKWVVLHEERFMPERFCFGLLDQNSLTHLFSKLAINGWIEALGVKQLFLDTFYSDRYGNSCPNEILQQVDVLNEHLCSEIIQWIDEREMYVTYTGSDKRIVSRSSVASIVGVDSRALSGNGSLTLFLRQFEPDFGYSDLLLACKQRTKYPSHKIKTKDEIRSVMQSPAPIKNTAKAFVLLMSNSRHFDCSLFPDAATCSVNVAYNLALPHCSNGGHTPLMPIDIGLSYLNEAVKWIHVYGEKIVDTYIKTAIKSEELKSTNSKSPYIIKLNDYVGGVSEEEFLGNKYYDSKSLKEIFNITEVNRTTKWAMYTWEGYTLYDICRTLIGSCYLLVAILKPSRAEELVTIKRENCLRLGNDGYYLRFKLGKGGAGELREEVDKPIPLITAKAIMLLQKFGREITRIIGDNGRSSDLLFYLPPKSMYEGKGYGGEKMMNRALNMVCDSADLPLDEHGRRWYVRTHEMRKWFILMLFWAGRYDVLDAVRDVAGHTDAEHTYAYIEKEFPGEELTELEAHYSVDRLREIDSSKSKEGAPEGLNELYEKVLSHFNASELSVIPESEWTDYVVAIRENDEFILEPHSVYADDGKSVVGLNVSFVIREAT